MSNGPSTSTGIYVLEEAVRLRDFVLDLFHEILLYPIINFL